MFAGQPERVIELSGAAVEQARGSGDVEALAAALTARHGALLHAEHLAERLELSEHMVTLARRAGQRELEGLAQHRHIYDLVENGELDRARAEHAELAALGRRAAPAAAAALRHRLGGRVGADGRPLRGRPAARRAVLRVRPARAVARRADPARGPDALAPAPARGARRRDRGDRGRARAVPGAGRVARGAAAGAHGRGPARARARAVRDVRRQQTSRSSRATCSG